MLIFLNSSWFLSIGAVGRESTRILSRIRLTRASRSRIPEHSRLIFHSNLSAVLVVRDAPSLSSSVFLCVCPPWVPLTSFLSAVMRFSFPMYYINRGVLSTFSLTLPPLPPGDVEARTILSTSFRFLLTSSSIVRLTLLYIFPNWKQHFLFMLPTLFTHSKVLIRPWGLHFLPLHPPNSKRAILVHSLCFLMALLWSHASPTSDVK